MFFVKKIGVEKMSEPSRYKLQRERMSDSSCVWKIKDGEADLLDSEGSQVAFLNRSEAYASVDLINATHDSLVKEINILQMRYSKLESKLSQTEVELAKLRKSNRIGW